MRKQKGLHKAALFVDNISVVGISTHVL